MTVRKSVLAPVHRKSMTDPFSRSTVCPLTTTANVPLSYMWASGQSALVFTVLMVMVATEVTRTNKDGHLLLWGSGPDSWLTLWHFVSFRSPGLRESNKSGLSGEECVRHKQRALAETQQTHSKWISWHLIFVLRVTSMTTVQLQVLQKCQHLIGCFLFFFDTSHELWRQGELQCCTWPRCNRQ